MAVEQSGFLQDTVMFSGCLNLHYGAKLLHASLVRARPALGNNLNIVRWCRKQLLIQNASGSAQAGAARAAATGMLAAASASYPASPGPPRRKRRGCTMTASAYHPEAERGREGSDGGLLDDGERAPPCCSAVARGCSMAVSASHPAAHPGRGALGGPAMGLL